MDARRHGFSLIELMVSMALCAVVIFLTMINVSFMYRGTVRAELEKLYATCMYLQQLAMSSNQTYALEFDEAKRMYHFNGRTERLDAAVQFGAATEVKGPPSDPHAPITTVITFPGKRIVFYPDGVLSSGTVYLTDRAKTTVYALSSAVAQVSHLRKYGYTNSWKLLP